MIDILISDQTLDYQCLNHTISDSVGGICSFVGTVRNQTQGKAVVKLEFEAYEAMAVSEMRKIAEHAKETWQLTAMIIHHRVGVLAVGEIPVIIIAAAPHRDAAFQACRYAIDTLKETVPIWKKEFFENEEVWVSAHP